MSISVRMVRLAAPTTPGLQSFTVAGMGTPKAAIIILTSATTNASSAAGAALAVGITDGVRQFCIASSSETATGDGRSNCNNRKSNTKCISLLAPNGTLTAEANWNAWDPGGVNGVEFNWTDAPSTAVLVTVILFSGADLSVYAGDFLASGSVTTNTVIADPNFQPDQLFVLGGLNAAYNSTAVGASMSIGFANRGGVITQCCSAWFADDNTNSSQGHNYVSAQYIAVGVNPTASTPTLGQNAIEITAFSAQGFTATTRVAGFGVRYPYLAFSYTSVNGVAAHWNAVVSSPTAAAPVQITVNAPGFKPQFVLQLPVGDNLLNAERITGTANSPGAGSYGIAAFTATEMFTNSIGDDDANGSILTESFSSTVFRCRSDIQTDLLVADSQLFTSFGWSLLYSVTHPIGRQWASMAIGEWPVPPVQAPVPVFDNSYRQRRM